MSHVETRPALYESGLEEPGLEEPGLETLLHMAATYEPERPAPEDLETRAVARLRGWRFSGFAWPQRTPWLALAGGAVAAAAIFCLQTSFQRPHSRGMDVAINRTIDAGVLRIPSVSGPLLSSHSSEVEPLKGQHPTRSSTRSTGRKKRIIRRRSRLLARHVYRPRPTTNPTVRWNEEVVNHEVEQAITPGWWITQNETTGDLEATPAAMQLVSTREIPSSSVSSCAPPDQSAPTNSETPPPPASQPGGPEEKTKE